MLNGLYIQSAWHMFHGRVSRIFMILENARVRATGGKFETSSLEGEVYEIRALQRADKGAKKITMASEGLQYNDRSDVKIPLKELDRLGVETILPDTKFYFESVQSVYRAVNMMPMPNQDMMRVSCERVRDPLPIFTSARVFSADDVGEPPTDWEVSDPTDAHDGIYVSAPPGLVTVFEDDFSGTTEKWIVVEGSPSIVNGKLNLANTTNNPESVWKEFGILASSSLVVEFEVMLTKANFSFILYDDHNYAVSSIYCYDIGSNNKIYRKLGSDIDTGATIVANVQKTIRLQNFNFTTHKYDIYIDGVLVCDQVAMDNNSDRVKSISIRASSNYGIGCDAFFDDVSVKYVPVKGEELLEGTEAMLCVMPIPESLVYSSHELQNDIAYPATTIECDFIPVSVSSYTNGIFGYVGTGESVGLAGMLGNSTCFQFQMVSGIVHFKKQTGSGIDKILATSTRYHLKFVIDRLLGTMTITVDSDTPIVIFSADIKQAHYFTVGAPQTTTITQTFETVNTFDGGSLSATLPYDGIKSYINDEDPEEGMPASCYITAVAAKKLYFAFKANAEGVLFQFKPGEEPGGWLGINGGRLDICYNDCGTAVAGTWYYIQFDNIDWSGDKPKADITVNGVLKHTAVEIYEYAVSKYISHFVAPVGASIDNLFIGSPGMPQVYYNNLEVSCLNVI